MDIGNQNDEFDTNDPYSSSSEYDLNEEAFYLVWNYTDDGTREHPKNKEEREIQLQRTLVDMGFTHDLVVKAIQLGFNDTGSAADFILSVKNDAMTSTPQQKYEKLD